MGEAAAAAEYLGVGDCRAVCVAAEVEVAGESFFEGETGFPDRRLSRLASREGAGAGVDLVSAVITAVGDGSVNAVEGDDWEIPAI